MNLEDKVPRTHQPLLMTPPSSLISWASYIVTLKNLSSTCEFGAFLPEALRDHLVCGMKDVPIQTKLLSERDLTFEKAKDLAMSMEMARSDLKLMSGAESDQRIHNVHYKHL